jgi:hypothetical protein
MKSDIKKTVEVIEMYARALPVKDKGFGITQHILFPHTATFDENKNLVLITEQNKEQLIKHRIELMKKCKTVSEIFIKFVHKPYRLTILYEIKDYMGKKEFTSLLADSWELTEYPHTNKIRDLIEMFKEADQNILFEDKKEKDYFDSLPEDLIIYRGTQSSKAKIRGLSWTLSKEKARWFSKRFKLNGKIYQAKIKKADIFYYSNGRSEEEVVINPFKLKKVKVIQ